jgi:antitoxin component of RelBE/YafQ-DinJ toxin-antitoxin module
LSATKLGLGTSSAIRLLADYASAVRIPTKAKQLAFSTSAKLKSAQNADFNFAVHIRQSSNVFC